MYFKKTLSLLFLLSLLAVLSTGCNANQPANPSNEGSNAETSGEQSVTQVLIGTHGSPAPYGWVEADGSLGGYDQAVAKAIDEVLPQYEFSFEIGDFPAIFSGLDNGRYLMGANNFSKTPEREEKYYFADESYIYNTMAIVFAKGRTDIQGPDDLGGKTAVTDNSGVTFQLYLEAYNEAHPDDPVDIQYADTDMLTNLTNVANGEIDFHVCEVAILNYYIKEFGLDLDYVVLQPKDAYGLLDLESYQIFPKTEEGAALRDAVNGALKELKENGTIAALSEEYFGFDMYASKEEA